MTIELTIHKYKSPVVPLFSIQTLPIKVYRIKIIELKFTKKKKPALLFKYYSLHYVRFSPFY